MDHFIQVVLDLVIEGSISSVGDRKVPMAIRVIAALILASAFCCLIGFSIFLILKDANLSGKASGALILLITLFSAYRFFIMYKKRKK